MKRVKYIFTCAAALVFVACGDSPTTGTNPATGTEVDSTKARHEHHEGDGHDHGESGRECHEHSTYYTCTDHQDVQEHEVGKCPKCKKNLVKGEDDAH